MKSLFFAVCLTLIAGTAFAQGGYIIYGPNGPTQVFQQPNGGIIAYPPNGGAPIQGFPTGNGGMNIYQGNRPPTQVMPMNPGYVPPPVPYQNRVRY